MSASKIKDARHQVQTFTVNLSLEVTPIMTCATACVDGQGRVTGLLFEEQKNGAYVLPPEARREVLEAIIRTCQETLKGIGH